MSAPEFTLQAVVLTEEEAFALAQLCKRISFETCRNMAVDGPEAYAMIDATNRVRKALFDAGVVVR